MVDEQKAQSEKDSMKRQGEADAAAYEKEKSSQAELSVAENKVKIAEQSVKEAKLEREAESEKQKSYTPEYFKDKELDVTLAAVKAINPTLKTIVTSGDGEGLGAIVGLRELLASLDQ